MTRLCQRKHLNPILSQLHTSLRSVCSANILEMYLRSLHISAKYMRKEDRLQTPSVNNLWGRWIFAPNFYFLLSVSCELVYFVCRNLLSAVLTIFSNIDIPPSNNAKPFSIVSVGLPMTAFPTSLSVVRHNPLFPWSLPRQPFRCHYIIHFSPLRLVPKEL